MQIGRTDIEREQISFKYLGEDVKEIKNKNKFSDEVLVESITAKYELKISRLLHIEAKDLKIDLQEHYLKGWKLTLNEFENFDLGDNKKYKIDYSKIKVSKKYNKYTYVIPLEQEVSLI